MASSKVLQSCPERSRIEPRRYQVYTRKDLPQLEQLAGLDPAYRRAMDAVACVFPFRVNNYVVEELIDWERIPDDPIFQLTFPQPGMLAPHALERMVDLLHRGASPREVNDAAHAIQVTLNPNPASQKQLNVPQLDGERIPGMQHKYRETVLFFPKQGQVCHSYCTYCFRWSQFAGIRELRFANLEAENLVRYLHAHPEVTDVLITGGDPMIMKTAVLRRYIEPLLSPTLEGLRSIRIATKATAFWPHRFLTDPDADDLLRLFEDVGAAGRQLALMSHYSHPRELQTEPARSALQRIRSTGANVRCQAPLIRHVNDDDAVWSELWQTQVNQGAFPYYMFVERDTGARGYFEVPLARAHRIFSRAYRRVSGLSRTVRGPSMSATPGKVVVSGVTEVNGRKLFVLQFIQARDPSWVGRPFLADYDPEATWLDQLRPAMGETSWFWERGMQALEDQAGQGEPLWPGLEDAPDDEPIEIESAPDEPIEVSA